jgi:hypothetical protein
MLKYIPGQVLDPVNSINILKMLNLSLRGLPDVNCLHPNGSLQIGSKNLSVVLVPALVMFVMEKCIRNTHVCEF